MRVNYKFQIQVSLDAFNFYLDKSVDIELSTFDCLGQEPFIKNLIEKVQQIYAAYTNLPFEKLAKDLDFIDLNFLLFLRTIERSNFDDVKFDGEPVTLVCRTGKDFVFSLIVIEG